MIINDIIHYKVDWGDTLNSIADKFDIDARALKYYNNVSDFYVGLILAIPQEIIVNPQTNNRTIEFYLKRHLKKRHLFNFYR